MPATLIVYANTSCLVLFDGRQFMIRQNETWDANDPLVKARPAFFDKAPQEIKSSVVKTRKVEQATANPGTVRG
jgi:hypothetical protein